MKIFIEHRSETIFRSFDNLIHRCRHVRIENQSCRRRRRLQTAISLYRQPFFSFSIDVIAPPSYYCSTILPFDISTSISSSFNPFFFFFFPRLIQFSQRWFNHNIKSNRFSIHNRFDYSLVFWEYSLLIFSLVLFKNRCKTFSLLRGDINQTFLALKANMARMINFLSSSLWSFFNASSMLLFRKLFFSFEKLIKILHHRICMQQHRLLISSPCQRVITLQNLLVIPCRYSTTMISSDY